MAIQTPKQRQANQKFNKNIEKNRKFGQPKLNKKDLENNKLKLSRTWLIVLGFLLVGGGLLEIVSLFFWIESGVHETSGNTRKEEEEEENMELESYEIDEKIFYPFFANNK